MKKQLAVTILLLSMPLFYVSCVSSLLKESPPTFSQEIKYNEPAAPFARMNTSVFPSWKNSKTGNVISIISDCDPGSSLSLSNLHLILEDSLTQVLVLKEESTTLHDRPAYFKNITAQLDGHAIEVTSISFKRKNCGYVSSLSGKKDGLGQDKTVFDTFNKGLSFE